MYSLNKEIRIHEEAPCHECDVGDLHPSVEAMTSNGRRSGAHDGEYITTKWPEQPMPTHADVALAIAILSRLCCLVEITLFVFSTDFRRWYHQWRYAVWVVWMVCMMWTPIPERGFHNAPYIRVDSLDRGIGCASVITQWIALYFIAI
jgi:hypothetical protein